MRIRVALVALAVLLPLPWAPSARCRDLKDLSPLLTRNIPPRPVSAATGSEFARRILALRGSEREAAIQDELLRGNLPSFLRSLKPVRLTHRFDDGTTSEATIFVMPDYLAIGANRDFLSIPMNRYTATEVAARFGFILPTKTMVDAIYRQSDYHLRPQPLPPGPQMCSTPYYLEHFREVDAQRRALCCPLGSLVSGHMKDVVLSNRLVRNPGRIAIYGWHRLSGVPIQPLCTVHGAGYADYSHGIRLVSDTVLIDGEPTSILDVLEDPRLAVVLNEEGPMPALGKLMHLPSREQADRSCTGAITPLR